MLIRLFGVIDTLIGLILILRILTFIPDALLIILGITLLAKSSLGLFKDFGGWVDLTGAVVLFLSIILTIPSWISLLWGILIFQKGIYSLF